MTQPSELNLSQDSAAKALAQPDAPVLIDVRDHAEFAARHIPGAKNIPLTEIAPLFDNPQDAEPMIFVCESGNRSMQAVQFALLAGLTNVRSLQGGMSRWLGPTAEGSQN